MNKKNKKSILKNKLFWPIAFLLIILTGAFAYVAFNNDRLELLYTRFKEPENYVIYLSRHYPTQKYYIERPEAGKASWPEEFMEIGKHQYPMSFNIGNEVAQNIFKRLRDDFYNGIINGVTVKSEDLGKVTSDWKSSVEITDYQTRVYLETDNNQTIEAETVRAMDSLEYYDHSGRIGTAHWRDFGGFIRPGYEEDVKKKISYYEEVIQLSKDTAKLIKYNEAHINEWEPFAEWNHKYGELLTFVFFVIAIIGLGVYCSIYNTDSENDKNKV